MRIIINADDFGFSPETVRATIECFERGGLSGATIMPHMDGTDDALRYAADHSEFSFGVHLTFTSDGWEHPLSPPEEIPGLVESSGSTRGQFLGPVAARSRALRNQLPVDQITREMRRQIARVRDAGVVISHVDSHGHVHKFRPFREALRAVLPEFDIRRVRTVQDVYLKPPLRSPVYWLGGVWRRRIQRQFVTTDHFFMPTTAHDADWPSVLLAKLVAKPAEATLEVGVHPGYDEPWRDAERAACVEFGALLRQGGHALIGWKDIGTDRSA